MEEELQKRNTDCVYFLASPLTCKKGMDCEYRHNEIARLNPRDCWYWLAGNCLNPTCGFRHPPLEKHAEAPSESASSSPPAKKTNVPCYFYYSGFCNKGDRCSFMHDPDASTPTGKSVNTLLAKEGTPLDNKTSVGNDIVSAPTEAHANPSETAPKAVMGLKLQPKEDVQLPAPKNAVVESSFPEIAVTHCEEAVSFKSDFLLQANSFIRSRSHISTDQSSEEQVDDHVEPEERWESSPGFDVLVDDKSENLGYKDDQEYLLALDREHRELNNHFLGYQFDDLEYDLTYCDADAMYNQEIYDSFDCTDNVHLIDDVGNCSGCSSGQMLDSPLLRKRKLLPMELPINGQRVVDLRDCLRKRRVIDGHPVIRPSRRHDSSRLHDRSRERPRRPSLSQRLHGRLASEVGKNTIGSLGDNGIMLNGTNPRGWHRHSRLSKSRLRNKENKLAKRQFLSSEMPSKPVPRERKYTQSSAEFTGPKSLAQIKEEKKKAEENGEYTGKTGYSSRMVSADFEGPKPLSEILKYKRKMGIVEGFDSITDDYEVMPCRLKRTKNI
ncbi:hypothetical protein P3X46_022830 [Hevea brasiliensis]|uniref:C3H1-type domain-containing protein n=1 Tax=Hevea brasiliensis TaxID=3981 RepID=A0ABQ9L957_HEVBR|nr:zinc finger CCCH domain-containing protein 34 [Hevea brasiliensis]KAJ9163128.1 hypothetical protein P3X46_022830 [Hevea brasiliensis]